MQSYEIYKKLCSRHCDFIGKRETQIRTVQLYFPCFKECAIFALSLVSGGAVGGPDCPLPHIYILFLVFQGQIKKCLKLIICFPRSNLCFQISVPHEKFTEVYVTVHVRTENVR